MSPNNVGVWYRTEVVVFSAKKDTRVQVPTMPREGGKRGKKEWKKE
jgi:hypothetical protein